MKIKSFNQAKLAHKIVLVRVDFNVPVRAGKIKDDFKIVANLEFLKYLIKTQAKIVLVTHLGEPKLNAKGNVIGKDAFSTAPLARHLSKLIGKKVLWFKEPIGSNKLKGKIDDLKSGQIAVLENIRFYSGEIANESSFAKQLAKIADVYINNAFAVSHRAHASVSAVKKFLPSFAGPLLAEEVNNLNKVLKPVKPMVAVLGGAKIETKINLIKNLSKRANFILVGGALMNNFLVASGHKVGKSLVSKEGVKIAKKLKSKKIIIPDDVVVKLKNGKIAWRHVKDIKKDETIVDIGPESMKLFGAYIKRAKTLMWNGPMGIFEEEASRWGTLFVARAVASKSSGKAFGVVGGGETIEALKLTQMEKDIDWISTGGGASLTYLAGETMPGLVGLVKK
jgi:phosphoglycerate kinase